MRRGLAILGIVSLCAPAALADYLFDPPWLGGEGGLGYPTYQGWEFRTDLDPTTVNNPYGVPTLDPGATGAWEGVFEGRDGVLRFEWWDEVNIDIPNADHDNPSKEVWFQITYFAFGGFSSLSYDIAGWGGETTAFGGESIGPTILESTAAGDWVYEAVHWVIEPNPHGETITLSSFFDDIYIDQIHIDTVCIPEPASVVLLAVGALVGLRRR